MEGYREDKDIERLLKLLLPTLEERLESALKLMLSRFKFFVSFEDFSRMLLLTLEEKMRLPEDVKYKLAEELKRIYQQAQAELPVNILKIPHAREGEFVNFTMKDARTLAYAEKLTDFYLGKFFQGDREIRLRALNWMSKYYLEKGNPIGKGQEGAREFLNQFKEYIKPQTEWKARQIIDTSVNYLRNAARIRGFQKAMIKYYRWDATDDRLTCRACRSMDGRVFKTDDAVRVLDMLEASEDPTLIKDLRPIITEPVKGPSAGVLTKFPPLHPNCRCRVVAELEEVTLPVTVERPLEARDTPTQRELEETYRAFSRKEIENRIRAHLASTWERPTKGGINAYKEAKAHLERHFLKHKDEFGFKNKKEYVQASYEVIKNPEAVLVERVKGKEYYIFKRGDKIVVSSEDDLSIQTFFKLKKPFEKWLKERVRDGLIRIL